MGGTVAMVLRTETETYKMLRWTNIIPDFLNDPDLFDKKQSWVDEFLKNWLEMKQDYEENKSTKKFKLHMTSCYHPGYDLAPAGYGLLVIDFVTNQILSMQGYSWPCHVNWLGSNMKKIDPERYKTVKSLYASGRLKQYKISKYEKVPILGQTFVTHKKEYVGEETLDLEPNMNPRKFGNFLKTRKDFIVDPSPFTIKLYDESPEGLQEFKQNLLDSGFVLTKKELKMWENFYDED